ncbi:MAG TPA: HAMP domain-containing sensor histidine kinase [Gammaproteobacteria bacterium]|nr:HAMP domain-containing sensor histidine kinase [Gammaproteobacteria bacterium]
MKLPSGAAFSVRGLVSVGLTALALLCLVVAGSVAWVSTHLKSTSAALVRDSESLRLATRIELQLLNYQRLAELAGDPRAQQELSSVNQDLSQSLADIVRIRPTSAQAPLVEDAVGDANTYLRRHSELSGAGIAPSEIRQQARPALNDALDSLRLLVATDEKEVSAAYAKAQRDGSFFIAVAGTTVLLAGGLVLLATIAIRRMLLRPVLGLRDTIDRFRSGEPLAKADEHAPQEIADIARAFNEMSEELGRQRARQLAFIAGVAHDLRNPLAALQFSLDTMKLRRENLDCETERVVDVLGRQLDHLSRMVNDLLETCYIEAGELTLTRENFDLRDAARAVVDLYGPIASDRDIDLELYDAPVVVHADRTRIEQVVGNLLSNSIKYSSAGTRIAVAVSRSDGAAELSVADHGVGISPEDRENIFRPFWRADRTGKRSGTGLGLSVVRKIVVAHEGTITVDSTPGAGSMFRVRMPSVPAEQQEVRERSEA